MEFQPGCLLVESLASEDGPQAIDYPLVGVVNLVPFGITAQVILVRTFKVVPVNEVVRGDGPCRYRVIVELLLFKKDANSSERRVPSAVS